MGTPLLKNAGVSNVVPAFRRQFREALLTVSPVHPLDEHYAEAQALRADIQRTLLAGLPQRPDTSARADSRLRQP